MVNFDTDTLTVWVNGFFALSVVSALLAVAALAVVVLSSRGSGSRPVAQAPSFAGRTSARAAAVVGG